MAPWQRLFSARARAHVWGCQMRNKRERVQNAATPAWFAEGSCHEEMTDNIRMGRGLKRIPG